MDSLFNRIFHHSLWTAEYTHFFSSSFFTVVPFSVLTSVLLLSGSSFFGDGDRFEEGDSFLGVSDLDLCFLSEGDRDFRFFSGDLDLRFLSLGVLDLDRVRLEENIKIT